MFRPIKSLITYIQKNASGGGAIFGGTTAIDEATNTNTAEGDTNKKEEESGGEHNLNSEKNKIKKMENELEPNPDQTSSIKSCAAALPSCAYNDVDDDEDDIEMQIKSSVMLKKTATNGNINLEMIKKAANNFSSNNTNNSSNSNTNYSTLEEEQDELEDFRHDPMQSFHMATGGGGVDDFCSVGSAEAPTGDEETAEEFNTEDEELEGADDSFLDLPHDLETYSSREIIVLQDTDLNSSIASDAPSEDPLALDYTTPPTIAIDSSTNDEGSASADMLWLGVVDIKSADNATITTQNLSSSESTTNASTSDNVPKHEQSIKRDRGDSMNTSTPEERAEELRSDGSDSGLGSETSALHNTLNSVAETNTSQVLVNNKNHNEISTPKCTIEETVYSSNAETITTTTTQLAVVPSTSATLTIAPVSTARKPLRSNLKRRLEVVDDDNDDDALDTSTTVIEPKKLKRSINFDNVQVFYFPRQQGFGCVPSAGGCTLGMSARHSGSKTLSLTEHAAEIRRAHRLQLQEINPRGSSSDESEESEEDYLSEGSGSDLDAESNGFLQPVSPKQRRALLKAAGVRKIDASEKIECRDIRNSREVCGCTCRDFCDPDTCACSQAGIKCQVDRAMFPCGCSREACGNTVGRVEFNPARVRTHFIHTIMRMEMENRQQQNPSMFCGSNTVINSNGVIYANTANAMQGAQSSTAAHYYSIQTQSNYSSGYASPAYTPEQTANYYQTQPQLTHYNGGGGGMGVGTSDIILHQQSSSSSAATSSYQMDSIDAGLFTTSSYGELLPTYGSSTVVAPLPPSAVYHHSMAYATMGNSSSIQSQVSPYATYHNHHHLQATGNYLPPSVVHNGGPTTTPPQTNTYSSCAVPSLPPFGTATTTAASAQYHNVTTLALDTTAPSCSSSSIDENDAGGNSFISLNTPIASSSRLSQINDLLQHNRNTTAALVVISQCSSSTSTSLTISNCNNTTLATTATSLASLSSTLTNSLLNNAAAGGEKEEEEQKRCLTFDDDEQPMPIKSTPLVAELKSTNSNINNNNNNNDNIETSIICTKFAQTEAENETKTEKKIEKSPNVTASDAAATAAALEAAVCCDLASDSVNATTTTTATTSSTVIATVAVAAANEAMTKT